MSVDIRTEEAIREDAPSILIPSETVWRVETAKRAAVLVDAADYFATLRKAMLAARSTIYIVGWDVDSRTRLVDSNGQVEDDLPLELGPFLCELVQRRPQLTVKILLWDYSVFFANEREFIPAVALGWRTPKQVDLCLDDSVPLGSSHHQKIVVIDEALAFCGGLDLTIRRWDSSDHRVDNPLRVDPDGKPYPPFHDVQMMLDGPAADALTHLVRKRWLRATGEALPLHPAQESPWPAGIVADFQDVAVGIARTEPHVNDEKLVNEVAALFRAMAKTAERHLYIESQYVTCLEFAEELTKALQERPALEALIVCPHSYGGWFERSAMCGGRRRFQKILSDAGVASRVLILAPHAIEGEEQADIKVHAKVMIVDDRYLRIGSANLCARSMATDSECDLVVDADGNSEAMRGIAGVRNRLLAEHCGVSVCAVAEMMANTGSLLTTATRLSERTGKLKPVEEPSAEEMAGWETAGAVADPKHPLDPFYYLPNSMTPKRGFRWGQATSLVGLALLAGLLAGAWAFTPLSELANPATLEQHLRGLSGPWEAIAVIGIFIIGGLVAFPLVVLIACTAAVFGGWPGIVYATSGAMLSALATYFIGRWLGKRTLRRFVGPRLNSINRTLAHQGILTVTTLRLMPIAPFTIVNLVAGALRVRPIDYILGTLLGMAPGLLLMSGFGNQVRGMVQNPSWTGGAILLGVLAASFVLSTLLQKLVGRLSKAAG